MSKDTIPSAGGFEMCIHLIPISLCIAFLGAATSDQPREPKQEQSAAGAIGNLERLWTDLADPNAAKANRAIWALTKTPKETVTYIAGHVKPVAAPDPRQIEKWIENLNSDTFALRDKAHLELTNL